MAWSTRKPKKPPEPLDEAALYEYALAALGRRMLTVSELKKRMRLRVEPGEPGEQKMQSVVARLKEYKLVDDARYAAEFSRLRQQNQKFGQRRVRQELMQRGVHSEITTHALETTYAETDETALALEHLRRKRSRPPKDDKETARLANRLMRAGFGGKAIWAALRKFKADESAVAELESAGPDDPA